MYKTLRLELESLKVPASGYQPSAGGPKYTMDTSVFPYTAETVGYNFFFTGRPKKDILL